MEKQPELQVSSICDVRGWDDWGSGAYLSSRGGRKHNGEDLVCDGGTIILSPIDGTVSRADGIVYPDPALRDWTYIQITDKDGNHCRHMYVSNFFGLEICQRVKRGQPIGIAQGIESRYQASETKGPMIGHIHFEVKNRRGKHINPNEYLKKADAMYIGSGSGG